MGWDCSGPLQFKMLARLTPNSRPTTAAHIPEGKHISLRMSHITIATCVTDVNRIAWILGYSPPRFSVVNTL